MMKYSVLFFSFKNNHTYLYFLYFISCHIQLECHNLELHLKLTEIRYGAILWDIYSTYLSVIIEIM